MKPLTALGILMCGGSAIWSLGWPSGGLSLLIGGINAFLAGALVAQHITYWHVDHIMEKAFTQESKS